MSTQGNTVELLVAETIQEYHVNDSKMELMTNKSAAILSSGDVVIQDVANARAVTLVAADASELPVFVVPQKDDAGGTAADKTIAINAAGYVQRAGFCGKIAVDGAGTIGQFLITSNTTKKAEAVSIWRAGVFGVLMSTVAAGYGTAILFGHTVKLPVEPSSDATKFARGDGAWAAPAGLTNTSAVLAADVTIVNVNTYYDAVSLSLAAGTWLVIGRAGLASATASVCSAKLWDGAAANYASDAVATAASASRTFGLVLTALVTLVSTTTIKLSCADNYAGTSNSKICKALGVDPAGDTATNIIAIKVG